MNEGKTPPNNPFDDLGDHPKPGTSSKSRTPLSDEEKERIKDLALKGLGVSEIAREMKHSKSSVSRVLKSLKTAKAIVIAKAGRIVDEKLHASQDLRKIHNRAFQILEKLKTETKENAEKYGLIVLKACQAVRKDLELQLRICEALYNAEEVARWQNELMDILGEIDPDARERFYRRYQERRPV